MFPLLLDPTFTHLLVGLFGGLIVHFTPKLLNHGQPAATAAASDPAESIVDVVHQVLDDALGEWIDNQKPHTAAQAPQIINTAAGPHLLYFSPSGEPTVKPLDKPVEQPAAK